VARWMLPLLLLGLLLLRKTARGELREKEFFPMMCYQPFPCPFPSGPSKPEPCPPPVKPDGGILCEKKLPPIKEIEAPNSNVVVKVVINNK